jgi:hypothetical protein
MATKLEHCFACYRLIRPGQTYYLTIEHEVLCADCALDEKVIRVRDDLAIEVKRDRLVVRRGKAEVEVFPGEIRHLVNALAEAAGRLVNGCSRDIAFASSWSAVSQKPGDSQTGAMLPDGDCPFRRFRV